MKQIIYVEEKQKIMSMIEEKQEEIKKQVTVNDLLIKKFNSNFMMNVLNMLKQ